MRIKVSYLILFVILLVPIKIKALSGNIMLDCTPNEVRVGSTINCSINGTALPTGITQLKANIVLDEGLSFKNLGSEGENIYFTLKNSWQGETDLDGNIHDLSGHYLDLYRTNPTVSGDSFVVGEFSVIVDNNASLGSKNISLRNVQYYYDDNSTIEDVAIDDATMVIDVVDDILNFPSDRTYDIDDNDKIVYRIASGMHSSEFLSAINANGNLSIIDLDNNPVANSTLLKSGYVFRVTYPSNVVDYKLSVVGDVLGDGQISYNGCLMVGWQIVNKNAIYGKEFLYAADYDGNGEIKMNDVIKMLRKLKGYTN